ncbi:MAG: TonB-dependent receptor, partial [Pseudomonadota bacterium]
MATASANDSADAYNSSTDADTIYVTAQKLEERSLQYLNTPAFGVGIGKKQIAAVNAFNVEDTFKYAPNLNVRKRFIGDNNATLAFRGSHSFQTPRALVSIDGFTISNFLGASFDTAPKWGVIAPGDVDRVEIIYGPTSARYSGHSLGGTLRLGTRDITENEARLRTQVFRSQYDYYATDLNLDGYSVDAGLDFVIGDRATLGVSYRYFQNEGQPQQWRRLVGGEERQALIDAGVVSAEYFNQAIQDDELTFLQIASEDSVVESTEQQIRVRGTYDFGNGWEGRGLLAMLIDEEDTTNPRSFLLDDTGAPSFIGVSGVSQGLSEDIELLVGLGLKGQLRGWAVDFALSRFDVLKSEDRRSDRFDTTTGLASSTGLITIADDTAWTSFEAIGERTYGNHDIAIGASYAGYSFDRPRFSADNWFIGSEGDLVDASGGETRLLGFFVEDAIRLSPQWLATFGVRAEFWGARNGFLVDGTDRVDYANRSDDAISPKGALTYTPTDDWSFTASAALATRFPTVQELYQPDLIAFGPNVNALDFGSFDPNLEPEEVLDLQLTASKTFSNAVVTVSLFRQKVDDTLFSQTVPELATSVTT